MSCLQLQHYFIVSMLSGMVIDHAIYHSPRLAKAFVVNEWFSSLKNHRQIICKKLFYCEFIKCDLTVYVGKIHSIIIK